MTTVLDRVPAQPAPAMRADEQARGPVDMLRDAFRKRATHAIEHMVTFATLEALVEALEARTDFGAVAAALGGTAMPASALDLDPLADALARGVGAREDLVHQAGGLLSGAEIGRILGGISRQAIDKRRRAHRLLAVNVAGDWRYPAAQLDAGGKLPTMLPAILREGAAQGLGDWAMLDFLLAADEALGGLTPLEAIRAGGEPAATVHRLLGALAADAFG